MPTLDKCAKILKFLSTIAPALKKGIKLIIYFTLLDIKGVSSSAIPNHIEVYYSLSQSFCILI